MKSPATPEAPPPFCRIALGLNDPAASRCLDLYFAAGPEGRFLPCPTADGFALLVTSVGVFITLSNGTALLAVFRHSAGDWARLPPESRPREITRPLRRDCAQPPFGPAVPRHDQR